MIHPILKSMRGKLSKEAYANAERMFADAKLFIETVVKIKDKKTKKLVPFKLNAEQCELLAALLTHNRIIIYKSRQIGISTLLRAYAYWRAYTATDPIHCIILGTHKPNLKTMWGITKTIHDGIPTPLQRKLDVYNESELIYEDTKAKQSVWTAGSKYGTRGTEASFVHLTEFAFYENQSEVLSSILDTVGDEQIVIETTCNKPNDTYHQMVKGAADGSNGWKLLTWYWHDHKDNRKTPPEDFRISEEESVLKAKLNLSDEQIYWRRDKINSMPEGLKSFRRENPGSIEDGFLSAEGTYFDQDKLANIKALMFDTNEKIYTKPHPQDAYAVGLDPAGGVGGDFSAMTIVSASTKQIVHQYRSNTISPTDFAEYVYRTCFRYKSPLILCESNNHGHVVLLRLQQLGYNRLWKDHNAKDWVTTVKSKLEAYEHLKDIINNDIVETIDQSTLMELQSLHTPSLCPEAPTGMHDDQAMSVALAYRCLRDVPTGHIQVQRRNPMDIMIEESRANDRLSNKLPWKIKR